MARRPLGRGRRGGWLGANELVRDAKQRGDGCVRLTVCVKLHLHCEANGKRPRTQRNRFVIVSLYFLTRHNTRRARCPVIFLTGFLRDTVLGRQSVRFGRLRYRAMSAMTSAGQSDMACSALFLRASNPPTTIDLAIERTQIWLRYRVLRIHTRRADHTGHTALALCTDGSD